MTTEIVRFFVGLDLGQSRDPSALAVVERAELISDEIDFVTYERRRSWRWRVLFLERMRLGTPYPDVVARVREVVRNPSLTGRCDLAMDATGLGAPVLDMLRAADLGCRITPVLLTGGEQESCVNGTYHVPKRDLITRLQSMLDRRELGLPAKFPPARDLGKEIADMGVKVSERGRVSYGAWLAGEHDDLVVATALACWRGKWKERPFWGTRSLGLG